MTPMAPERPFFFGIDIQANPPDALWIGAASAVAMPSGAWVEIVHCSMPAPTKPGVLWPGWKMLPLWMYVAPGSGVSINIGRTHVADGYGAAVHLLARLFTGEAGGTVCPGNRTIPTRVQPAPEGYEWHAPYAPRNGSMRSRLRARRPHISQATAVRARDADAALDGSLERHADAVHELTDAELGQLDSIQILRHGEFFSAESRHEIIMLRYRECAKLDGSMVQCGRHPHLFPCDAKRLRRATTCTSWNRPWKAQRVKKVLGMPQRCLNTSCYLEGAGTSRAAYYCPASVTAAV